MDIDEIQTSLDNRCEYLRKGLEEKIQKLEKDKKTIDDFMKKLNDLSFNDTLKSYLASAGHSRDTHPYCDIITRSLFSSILEKIMDIEMFEDALRYTSLGSGVFSDNISHSYYVKYFSNVAIRIIKDNQSFNDIIGIINDIKKTSPDLKLSACDDIIYNIAEHHRNLQNPTTT